MYPGSKPVKVLLIEDEASDSTLIAEAFDAVSFYAKMYIVEDGEEAVQYLTQTGNYTNAETPDLILLDLNLPKRNGLTLLEEFKSSAKFRRIPIIVLATDSSSEIVKKCYELQANSFIAKPTALEGFFDLVKKIEDFWLKTVRLPS